MMLEVILCAHIDVAIGLGKADLASLRLGSSIVHGKVCIEEMGSFSDDR